MSTIKRFSALLYENQVAFLRREAARRGISDNEALRRALDSVMAMGLSASNTVGWTPQEAELRDKLADTHGLVLTKLDRDRFAVRCANETIKINRKKAASLKEVRAFFDALEVNTPIHKENGDILCSLHR